MKKNILLSTVFSVVIATSAMAEDKVIATVNGQPIYQAEMQRNINAIPNFDELPAEQQKIIKDKIIQAVTKLTAVVQEAEKLKVQETPAFKEKMADFKQQLMYSSLLENHITNAVTETKLKEYYEKNKKDFIESKAKASHILVATKAEADEVIAKLTAGEDFAKLAKEFSIGPSAADGGNLGWFDKKTMVPEFSEAVFALKTGEFTKQGVQTQFGWHVIILEEKVEDTPALFEDVESKIKEVVMQDEVENYLDKIINKADIVINDEE
tara:strand:- start:777 stop:1577 length:801 start_codon:yes stop_codon:yes gene_type:complete